MHRSGTVIGALLMHLRILIKSAWQPIVAHEKTETQGTCSKYMADLAPECSTAFSWMLEVTMALWWGRSTGWEGHTSHPVSSRRIQATRMAIQVRDKESLKQGGFSGGGERAWEPSRRWADWLNVCVERSEGQLRGLGGDAMRWDGTGEEKEEFYRIWFVTPNLRCPWDGQVMSSHARNSFENSGEWPGLDLQMRQRAVKERREMHQGHSRGRQRERESQQKCWRGNDQGGRRKNRKRQWPGTWNGESSRKWGSGRDRQ